MDHRKPYQDALNKMAHIISHQVRQPIGTMTGLVNLMERDLISEEERADFISSLKGCLIQLNNLSRELAALIYAEQMNK